MSEWINRIARGQHFKLKYVLSGAELAYIYTVVTLYKRSSRTWHTTAPADHHQCISVRTRQTDTQALPFFFYSNVSRRSSLIAHRLLRYRPPNILQSAWENQWVHDCVPMYVCTSPHWYHRVLTKTAVLWLQKQQQKQQQKYKKRKEVDTKRKRRE